MGGCREGLWRLTISVYDSYYSWAHTSNGRRGQCWLDNDLALYLVYIYVYKAILKAMILIVSTLRTRTSF